MKHAIHRMHLNSLEAYEECKGLLGERARAVLQWIEVNGPATDRQVMHGLGKTDPNSVRPRISDLIECGMLDEVEPGLENGRSVRRTARTTSFGGRAKPDRPEPEVTTDHYFESHVTVDAVTGIRLMTFNTISEAHGFRVATFIMVKEGDVADSFTSTRSKYIYDIHARTKRLMAELEIFGFKVKRYKIENTLEDVRCA